MNMSYAVEIHSLESKAVQHLSLLAVAAVDTLVRCPGDGNSKLGSISHSLLWLVQECNDHCNSIAKAAGVQSTSARASEFRLHCVEAAVQFLHRASASPMRAEIEKETTRLRCDPEFDPDELLRKTELFRRETIITTSHSRM
jgi:hypothetical protein